MGPRSSSRAGERAVVKVSQSPLLPKDIGITGDQITEEFKVIGMVSSPKGWTIETAFHCRGLQEGIRHVQVATSHKIHNVLANFMKELEGDTVSVHQVVTSRKKKGFSNEDAVVGRYLDTTPLANNFVDMS